MQRKLAVRLSALDENHIYLFTKERVKPGNKLILHLNDPKKDDIWCQTYTTVLFRDEYTAFGIIRYQAGRKFSIDYRNIEYPPIPPGRFMYVIKAEFVGGPIPDDLVKNLLEKVYAKK